VAIFETNNTAFKPVPFTGVRQLGAWEALRGPGLFLRSCLVLGSWCLAKFRLPLHRFILSQIPNPSNHRFQVLKLKGLGNKGLGAHRQRRFYRALVGKAAKNNHGQGPE